MVYCGWKAPERNPADGEGVVVDARGGESNPQHVLFRGDVVWLCDAVQLVHVAESTQTDIVKKKKNVSVKTRKLPPTCVQNKHQRRRIRDKLAAIKKDKKRAEALCTDEVFMARLRHTHTHAHAHTAQ